RDVDVHGARIPGDPGSSRARQQPAGRWTLMRVVVLGGSGDLGRAIVTKAKAAGHDVTSASRRGDVKVDVTTGRGLDEAFAGVDVVMDATNALAGAHDVLV